MLTWALVGQRCLQGPGLLSPGSSFLVHCMSIGRFRGTHAPILPFPPDCDLGQISLGASVSSSLK